MLGTGPSGLVAKLDDVEVNFLNKKSSAIVAEGGKGETVEDDDEEE